MNSKIILCTGGARSGKSEFAETLVNHLADQFHTLHSSALKAYVATGQAFDDEMKARIEKHQLRRGEGWLTFEWARDLSAHWDEVLQSSAQIILLDCLTMYVSNALLRLEMDVIKDGSSAEQKYLSVEQNRVSLEKNQVSLEQSHTNSKSHTGSSKANYTSLEENYITAQQVDVLAQHVAKDMEVLIEKTRAAQKTLILVTNEVGQGIVPDNALSRHFRDIAGLLNQKVACLADEVYVTISGITIEIKSQEVRL